MSAHTAEVTKPFEDASVLIGRDERVGVLSLNRPRRLNAFSLGLEAAFQVSLKELEADPDIRVIVVKGEGGRAFSTGYDLTEEAEGGTFTPRSWAERLAYDFGFTMSVWNCPKPVIAEIEGYCLGGGMELAGVCDLRYCSEDATFGVIETRFSSAVVTMILPWILGARCRELIYTGDTIDAPAARELGFVTRIFQKDRLHTDVVKLAKRMSMVSSDCLVWNKRMMNRTFETMGLRTALESALDGATILDSLRSPEYARFDEIRRSEGLKAAIAWRNALFERYT